MKRIAFLSGLFGGLLTLGIMLPAYSQVTSDSNTNTTVNSNGNNFNIINGIQKGNNLFHSFDKFSLPQGNSATFDLTNTPNINTIFSRVTGGNVSNINGLIQTINSSNAVNLFLMNPVGIVFGENAKLNIGGSFYGTTANSILFQDGFEFSAVNPPQESLLTVSVPVGLQMGKNPGAITVQGTGHQMTSRGFMPLDRSKNPIGLQVSSGNTLALIGSTVNFSGGIASVNDGGHLELGSVSNGQVHLNPKMKGWVGDYSNVSQFSDIHLAQQSLLDASGSNGSIQIQGRNISLSEGSSVVIQNLGTQKSGGITLNATESLKLAGNTPNGQLGSSIEIDNLGENQIGDIIVSAAQLSLQDGGQIKTRLFTQASGGNITVNVAGSINMDGFIFANPRITSVITTSTLGSGNAGNITVSTGNLRLTNSGVIVSATGSLGRAGAVQIKAADLIEIAGYNPITFAPSSITATTFGSGNANDIVVNTNRLMIRDGGLLGSSALLSGATGSVKVNASEFVEIDGRPAGLAIIPSRIASAAEILEPATQAAFEFPPIPSGDSGSLTINTPSLRITNEGYVTVRNDGPGKAGNLQINGNSISLDNQSRIIASTASGNGGDIHLNLQDILLMRNNSLISATAAGKGNGGNLSINAPIIVGLENSDIVVNAVAGNGGNIDITTQGIFGLKFRNELTENSDITASSEFGVNGTVDINNFGIDPSSGLIELTAELTDSSQQVATGCSNNTNSNFIATGRGGIPQNPTEQVDENLTWSDVRDLSAYRQSNNNIQATQISNKSTIIEATGFIRNDNGEIELVAAQNTPFSTQQVSECSGASL